MHGKRMVTMIIVTDESVAELGARLRPLIGGADTIENFWMLLAPKPDDVFGQHGNFDPAVHRVREAWVEAGKTLSAPRGTHFRGSKEGARTSSTLASTLKGAT